MVWPGIAAHSLRLLLARARAQAEKPQVRVVGRHRRVHLAHRCRVLRPRRHDLHRAAVGQQRVRAGGSRRGARKGHGSAEILLRRFNGHGHTSRVNRPRASWRTTSERLPTHGSTSRALPMPGWPCGLEVRHVREWPGLLVWSWLVSVPGSGAGLSQCRQMSRCTGMSRGMSRSPGMNGTSSSKMVASAGHVDRRSCRCWPSWSIPGPGTRACTATATAGPGSCRSRSSRPTGCRSGPSPGPGSTK